MITVRWLLELALIIVALIMLAVAYDLPAAEINIDVGLAIQDKNRSYNQDSPLGIIQAEIRKDQDSRLALFAQHISSIPNSEDNYGFNMVGLTFRVWK